MKKLIFLFLIVGGIMVFWNKMITNEGLIQYYDENPTSSSAPFSLFYMARWNDLFGSDERALHLYQRIVDRYIDTGYGMEASFAAAVCLERLKRFQDAYDAYVSFSEKFPKSKYATSVKNKIYRLETNYKIRRQEKSF